MWDYPMSLMLLSTLSPFWDGDDSNIFLPLTLLDHSFIVKSCGWGGVVVVVAHVIIVSWSWSGLRVQPWDLLERGIGTWTWA